jgi:hypothetical protein
MDAANTNNFLFVSGLFKALPAEEAGERMLYLEASNEHVDLQGEKVLAKSLADSADHFLRYGNIDLDHRTLLPPANAEDNPYRWEIGRPIEVQADADRTLVKAQLYRGDGPAAANASLVWDSLTNTSPPARWYPSVGGQILERGTDIDPLTKATVRVIRRVRWTNIGLSRTPVNSAVPPASTIPAEIFAKCCTASGCLDIAKALEAGYGTDSATLTGGAALRTQSIDRRLQATLPASWLDVRELLAKRARKHSAQPEALMDFLTATYSLSPDDASRQVERFLRDLRANHQRRLQ